MSMRSILPTLFDKNNKPGTPVDSLHRAIERVFEDFNQGFVSSEQQAWPALFSGGEAPKIDLVETDTAIEVSAELPGVEQDDIDVTIVDDILTIKGEKKQEKEEKEKDYHLVERCYGSFQRSIRLPFAAKSEADATFKNGVLKLKIKKPPEFEAKTWRIPIRGA